jgi:enoyl-[acyl-carrier-protein] reductase (NADH)
MLAVPNPSFRETTRKEEETMRFTDRVAIITAAASGIGRATADIMAREGAIVVTVDIDQARLDDTVAALRAAGGRAVAKRADALDAVQVDAVAAAVAQEFGALAVLNPSFRETARKEAETMGLESLAQGRRYRIVRPPGGSQ